MTWVRSRRWNETQGWFVRGRIHWMVRPWKTLCGQVVGADWGDEGMPSVTDPNLCKRCVPPTEEDVGWKVEGGRYPGAIGE